MCFLAFPCLLLILTTPITARPQNSLVLTYDEGEGKIQYFSDGTDVVFAYLSSSGDLVDCDIGKLNGSAPIFDEALSGRPQNSQFITFDLRRLARQCRRYLRKMLRLDEKDKSASVGSMKKRIKLHMGYPGTKWCMTNRPTSPSTDVDKAGKAADKCCEAFHNCEEVIQAAGLALDVYNYYPWPVYSCTCTDTFHQCLLDAKTPVSLQVGDIYFNVVGVRCYRQEKKQKCTKWDPWYTTCIQYQYTQTAHFVRTKTFDGYTEKPSTETA